MGLFGSSPRVQDTVPDKTWNRATKGEPKGALRADEPGGSHGKILGRCAAWSKAQENAGSN